MQRHGHHTHFCIGVHAFFSGDALSTLTAAGASTIVTCNTETHQSNRIDVLPEVATALSDLLAAVH